MSQLDGSIGKSALGSVGVWGSLGVFGVYALDALQKAIDANILPAKYQAYLISLSALIALIGRVKAKKQITGIIAP